MFNLDDKVRSLDEKDIIDDEEDAKSHCPAELPSLNI
jgi:hypothetical protein